MFENNEKGSFGCYSDIGKFSAMKYYTIVNKDKFLHKDLNKNTNSHFSNPEKEINEKETLNFTKSIFDKIPKKKFIKLKKIICEPEKDLEELEEKKKKFSKFKYHKHNHKEITNIILKRKLIKKYDPSSTKYNPKLEYIYKKILGPPIFNSMTGRNDRKLFFGIHLFHSNSSPNYLTKDNKIKKKYVNDVCKKIVPILEYNSSNNINKNLNKSNHKKNQKEKLPLKNSQKGNKPNNYNNSYEKLNLTKEKKKNYSLNKNKKYYKTIDFSKITSREYVYYINRNREEPTEFILPNYDYVSPKCKTMIKYNKQSYSEKKRKEFKGLDFSTYIDFSKGFNKINNNKESQTFSFDKMISRPDQKTLPSFMIRNGINFINNITNKSLEMNNFSNSRFLTCYSSFEKKSFNTKINMNLLCYNQKKEFSEIIKKLNRNKSISHFLKFYKRNYNYLDENNIDNKIDGITFKSYKNNVKLPEKEYNRFSIKFKDNEC